MPKLGVTLHADGADLVLRYKNDPPEDFVQELREHKPELIALLTAAPEDSPAACRGCAGLIPAGTTPCANCGSAQSPLVRYALELSALTEERTLRGQAIIALDSRRYPKLRLPDGRIVGPGLIPWCPVLREGKAATFRAILRLVESARRMEEGDD